VSVGSAGAAEPRLQLAAGSACPVDSALLDQRITGALIGTPEPDLHVELSITSAPLTARLTLLRGARALGSKEIAAASCDEALDAVIAVAALALSAPQPAPLEVESNYQPSDPIEYAPEPPRAELADAIVAQPDAARWRWLAGAGADHGSLAESTLVLRVGAGMALGPGELRALAWYGVPSIREEIGDALERTQSDFGAMALDYCLHLTGSGWLAACGGIEAGARRFTRLERGANQERSEAERIDGTLAAAAGLALSYRGGFVQPALDVLALAPVVGGIPGTDPFGFRAVFGAALPF